jgi:hypothetical protein
MRLLGDESKFGDRSEVNGFFRKERAPESYRFHGGISGRYVSNSAMRFAS